MGSIVKQLSAFLIAVLVLVSPTLQSTPIYSHFQFTIHADLPPSWLVI